VQAIAGQPISTSLTAPAGDFTDLGARVEVPVTRAIVSYWRLGLLTPAAGLDPAYWSVTLDPVVSPGDYQLVWRTSDDPPTFETFIPLTVVASDSAAVSGVDYPPVDTESVRPTVEEIARLENTRTDAGGGGEVNEFTEDTRPTYEEVDELIDIAMDQVLSEIPPKVPDTYYSRIGHAIALYTAVLVEGAYFREQADGGSVDLWNRLYTAAITGLNKSIDQDLRQALLLRRMEPTPIYQVPPGRVLS
jgi:hypothetical protein